MREDLQELAARVEALSGPDREVDAWIWFHSGVLLETCPETAGLTAALAVGYFSGRRASIPEDALTMADVTPAYGCPAYTASLDAAMTLVPQGAIFGVTNCGVHVELADMSKATAACGIPDDQADPIEAATPALALCAAALRARSQASPEPRIDPLLKGERG